MAAGKFCSITRLVPKLILPLNIRSNNTKAGKYAGLCVLITYYFRFVQFPDSGLP